MDQESVKGENNGVTIMSFATIKEALAKATLLHHPVQGATTALSTDASDTLGAVLEQKTGN